MGASRIPRTCWHTGEWRDEHRACMALWRFVEIEDLHYDLMHTKHLGTDAYFLGSVLAYLIDFKMEREPAENLKQLWAAIKTAYQDLKTTNQFSNLTLTMFRAGSNPFPCLKGKASEIRHLVPAMEKVSNQFLNRQNPQEELMIRGLQLSRGIDACLLEVGRAPRQSCTCIEPKWGGKKNDHCKKLVWHCQVSALISWFALALSPKALLVPNPLPHNPFPFL